MNPRAQELLVQWILHVMKMLVGMPLFSQADRAELARITMELDQELMRVRGDQAVSSCEGGHRGPFVRDEGGLVICHACGLPLNDWGQAGKY